MKNILEQITITYNKFKELKSKDLVEFKCPICNNTSYLEKHYVLAKIKHYKIKFCSKKCAYQAKQKGQNKKCANCSKEIYVGLSELKDNNF